MKELLISGGRIVDAANNFDQEAELSVACGQIVECSADVTKNGGMEVIDATGRLVIPGLVDSHVHVAGGTEGYYMLARAGVTSALDMMGMPQEIKPYLGEAETGLNLAFLYPLLPDRTVSGTNPGRDELTSVISKALEDGAFGIKIVGGHYPLTPEALCLALEVAAEMNCYCAVHAGSTVHGSNIEGLEELVAAAGELPVHVAHLNSYCRGQITGNPVEEAGRALNLLKTLPNAVSESYLDLINGTSGRLQDGVPLSNVTKNCLKAGGYPVSATGLEDAIKAGWAQVHGRQGREIVLLDPEAGYELYRSSETRVMLSFAVNSPGAAIGIATAKDNGKFIVNALSTDGGNIPRNTTIRKALPLVSFGAFSMLEFVQKACMNPAKMLHLDNKGHFSPGADADITIINPLTAEVERVISSGQTIYCNDEFYPAKCKLINRP